MNTTNKQTEQKLQDLQSYAEGLQTIETFVLSEFTTINRINNIFYIDIEVEGKVKKLERLKDYLNNNTNIYILSICFGGGRTLEDYTTLAKVEIVE